jgi:hypothetical protein
MTRSTPISPTIHRALVALALGAAACASGTPEDGTPKPSASPSPSPSPDAGVAPSASVRGNRYCELLIVYVSGVSVDAQVWGTQGLNECPAATWTALDTGAIQAELGATVVRKNGPRYWLLDAISAQLSNPPRRTFGGLEMQRLATIAVAPGAIGEAPYRERTVNRNSRFTWRAGAEVYELLGPDGAAYVMQSYAQIQDPALEASALPSLGSRLALPEGWTYRARTLTEDLVVDTPGQATVLQDELNNTYSKLTSPR